MTTGRSFPSSPDIDAKPPASNWWPALVSAIASILMSVPLIMNGTPDVESYSLSIFSTMAFARNLIAGVDPWFVPGYGFGIPLPTSTWLIKFPGAFPAALASPDVVYAVLWLTGEFLFAFFILKLTLAITPRRSIALFALVTGLLSFSNLGPTFKDDWPEHFVGWALFPAALWFILRTLQAETAGERLRRGAACAFVLGIYSGSTHQNENVTFYSGIAVLLAVLAPSRPKGVATVAAAALVGVLSAADVMLPTVEGMLGGGVNPVTKRIAVVPDDLTLSSYEVFLEPLPTLRRNHSILRFTYERTPFFGALGLLLGAVGAAGLLLRRHTAGTLPRDIQRALGLGFILYSVLTLMPAWVALGLPRMWMYRDGQTVFAILCAAAALHSLAARRLWLVNAAVVVQVAQLAIVATPFVTRVLDSTEARTFGYSRHEHVLFDGLRRAGIDERSRIMLAGELESLLRGGVPAAGITADTDFVLEHLSVVNAWYRGGATPALGGPSMDGRYGAYETLISWKRALQHLDGRGLDVLGITHVLALVSDSTAIDWASHLSRAATIDLPGGAQVAVFRNDDAWQRASLLPAGSTEDPPLRPDCQEVTIYCRDFHSVADPSAPIALESTGSSLHVSLTSPHPAGRLFVSQVFGRDATAEVDGVARPVHPFLGQLGIVDVGADARDVVISLAPRRARLLTLSGIAVLACCLAVAIVPRARAAR